MAYNKAKFYEHHNLEADKNYTKEELEMKKNFLESKPEAKIIGEYVEVSQTSEILTDSDNQGEVKVAKKSKKAKATEA